MNMQKKLRTLLVDDEALSRRGLELRLSLAADVEIIGHCANGREALDAIRDQRPDLVFLDIQMPGLSGFDVLAELQPHELPMIVFVTAYDRFAVQAFEARAIDYVLKPVDDVRLAATLNHVRELTEQRAAVTERNQLVNLLAELRGSGELGADDSGTPTETSTQTPNWLPIRNGRETVRVPVQSIEWVDAAGDYLCIHASGHKPRVGGHLDHLGRPRRIVIRDHHRLEERPSSGDQGDRAADATRSHQQHSHG
jgi:two-component system LytT family response regulator